MRAKKVRVLEGPNIWSKRRMLELLLASDLVGRSRLALISQRIAAWWTEADEKIPTSEVTHIAWPCEPRDDVELLMVLMLNLQRRAGLCVSQGFVRRDEDSSRTSRLAIEIVEEAVGLSAYELACDLWAAACGEQSFDFVPRLKQFRELAFEHCLGQTTGAIVFAAKVRGIPVLRLDEISLVQLGHGSRQRRIQTAISDHSSFIAESVSRDKSLTKLLLKRVGLPVPDGRVVSDAEDAWAAACEIGAPVVVKPRDADYGQGVSLKLVTRAEISAAYQEARSYSEHVIVERFLEGAHHRLMIVGRKVVAAVRFERAVVVGDGRRTVAELIAQMNLDPRRGARNDSTRPWFWMEVDDETCRVLKSQGSGLEHIPQSGERIVLRFEPRIGWGGGVFDVTDEVHPDVATTAIDAVSMVGLDIAGVDLIANDISRPLEEQHGGLLEVNAGPAILMHLRPFSDPPRPVPEAIVSLLFPHADQSRIPIVSICGNNRDDNVANHVTKLLQGLYAVVGQATRAGVLVNQRCLSRQPGNNLQGSRMLLLHPRVEAAVIEVSLDHLCDEGLAFDESRIAIILGKDFDSENNDFRTDDRAAALEVLLETVPPTGTVIVDVDNSQIEDILLRNANVIAISNHDDYPAFDQILQNGGRIVFLREAAVILAHRANEISLLASGRAMDDERTVETSVSTMLMTIATGWALGIEPELLRQHVQNFVREYAVSAIAS